MSFRYNLRNRRTPEEGPSCGAGPATSGGSDHITIGQWRGSPRDPRRGIRMYRQPEAASGINSSDTESSSQTSENPERTDSHSADNRNIDSSAERALAGIKPATTKAGKIRQRMKWNAEVNKYIIRCYFKATNLETDFTTYRSIMYQYFKEKYPHINVTEQRIADQRRAIFKKQLLPANAIDVIKVQVEQELAHVQTEQELAQTTVSQTHQEPEKDESQLQEHVNLPGEVEFNNQTQLNDDVHLTNMQNQLQIETNNLDTDIERKELEFSLRELIIKFQGCNPNQRPVIPKQKTSTKLASIVHKMNEMLPNFTCNVNNITDLNTLIYCAAYACAKQNGSKITELRNNNRNKGKSDPRWKKRLEKRTRNLRADIDRLTKYEKGIRTKRLSNKIHKIIERYRIHTGRENPNSNIKETLDTMKQKLMALLKRLRRYNECTQRKAENKLFRNNEGRFYRKLNKKQETLQELPTEDQVYNYWKNLWSGNLHHNQNAQWIEKEKARFQAIPEMPFELITTEDIKNAINKSHNWKSPGPDGIHNYWFKKFTALHPHLQTCFNTIVNNPQSMPKFLTAGITYLLPKNEQTKNPANYRPITCLCTTYKLLTSCITNKIYDHCMKHSILAEEQKGCCKNSQGSKEQLVVDMVVMNQAHKKKRNIYTAYIDYIKAYDSVPHSWLREILKIYKINPLLINFLQYAMTTWKTVVKLGNVISREICINQGIFQGDSLSPLWFCLALNPLSNLLKETKYGFNIKVGQNTMYNLTHLLYIDDIKLYAGNSQHLKHLLSLTESFSLDIHMRFGIDKCKTQCIAGGKRIIEGFELVNREVIEGMGDTDSYKYLGILQSKLTETKTMKENLTCKYVSRVKSIVKTKLYSRELFKAINTYAVPVLTYSFGIVKWTHTDIADIKRMTSKILTGARDHHPKSSTERLTLPRISGGRGLIDLHQLYNKQKNLLRKYFFSKAETSLLHHAIKSADNNYTPLNLIEEIDFLVPSDAEKLETWQRKSLHGKHANDLDLPHVDKVSSNAWLTRGELFPETEGFMTAIQDQVINTKNYKKYIIKDGTRDDSCRRCKATSETIHHIISGCQTITQSDYKQRHDNACKILHQKIAVKCSLLTQQLPYYKYRPENILENLSFKLYWDRGIITDKTVANNRPDITLIDKKAKLTYIIDIAVPNTNNLQSSYSEKVRKYTDLKIEIQKQWKMHKVYILPVIISATGMIPLNFHDSIKQLDLNREIFIEVQKAVILSTCNIVRKFLG